MGVRTSEGYLSLLAILSESDYRSIELSSAFKILFASEII